MAGSLILNIGYGIDAQSLDDPYLVIVEKPVGILTAGANPAAFLVNSIPIRVYNSMIVISRLTRGSKICAGMGSRRQLQEDRQGMAETHPRNRGPHATVC